GMGPTGEAVNNAHQVKKLDIDALKTFRDRFNIPIEDKDLEKIPYYRPADDSAEMQYLQERRRALSGYLPSRKADFDALPIPSLDVFSAQLKSTGDREISTTMAFVRALNILIKDKTIGKQIVPIVPDEARTFGMEG